MELDELEVLRIQVQILTGQLAMAESENSKHKAMLQYLANIEAEQHESDD